MVGTKRSRDLAVREQNGDERAINEPVLWLASRPKFTGQQITNQTGELVLFLQREYFADGAKGFGNFKGDKTSGLEEHYRFALELFFLLIVGLPGDLCDGLERSFITWTPVPAKDDPQAHSGFLLRVVFQCETRSVAEKAHQHVEACQANFDKGIIKGKRSKFMDLAFHYMRLHRSAYLDMGDCYLGNDDMRSQGATGTLYDDVNPYNPFKIFTMARALEKIRTAQTPAAEEFYNSSNYAREGRVCFPNGGEKTLLLTKPSQFSPMVINKIYFPHRERRIESKYELDLFAANAGLADVDEDRDDNDSEAGDEADRRFEKRRKLDELFKRLANSDDADEQNDIDSVRRRCTRLMQMTEAEHRDKSPKERALARRETQKKCLDIFFRDVFNDDDSADAGDAIKAIAGWYKEFLKTHDNFMMPMPKMSSNLSRNGDLHCRDAAAMETVWAINTAHQEVKGVRLASMHVYWYSPFHAHTALLGPPGCGKSNVFKVNQQRLIPGTSRDIGSETSKAKMTPGNKTDMMIETFEDVPPNQLGISSFTNHAKPGAVGTSNTDGESLLKYRLTKGRIFGTYKVVKDGKHMMLEVESWCNTVMLVGMNSALCQVPTPIASRFVNMQFQYKDRVDAFGEAQGLFTRYNGEKDPKLIPLKNSLIVRDMRNQCFHALIGLCIHLGIFYDPDMNVAFTLWNMALAKGKKKGLHETGNIRHLERLYFYAQSLIVDDATDRCLDSELSPFDIKVKWHRYHLLEWEKHLYSNTEHAAMAMGLLQHQWENPIVAALEEHFKKVLLKDKIKMRDIGKPMHPNEAIRNEMADYYVIKNEFGVNFNSMNQYDQQKASEQSAMIGRLTDMCYSTMNPKPDKEEISHALMNMMSLHIEIIPDKEKPKVKKLIPSLCFSSDGEIMIAVSMMENFEKNRLMKCLKEVLCHAHTHHKNIIYGQMLPRTPWVFHCLKIEPNPKNLIRMTSSNYHSESTLRMTHQLIAGVNSTAHQDDPSMVPRSVARNYDTFKANFATTPHKDLDMDLDEMAAKLQADRIGLQYLKPTSDAPNCNTSVQSFNNAIHNEILELIEKKNPDYDNFDKLQYPLCFSELSDTQYRLQLEDDRRANPEKYLVSHSIFGGKSAKRQKRAPADSDESESKAQFPDDAEMNDFNDDAMKDYNDDDMKVDPFEFVEADEIDKACHVDDADFCMDESEEEEDDTSPVNQPSNVAGYDAFQKYPVKPPARLSEAAQKALAESAEMFTDVDIIDVNAPEFHPHAASRPLDATPTWSLGPGRTI